MTSTARALWLVALFVAGQAAALSLIDVAPYGVFQHYLAWGEVGRAPVALAILVGQTIVCLAVAGRGGLAAIAGVLAGLRGLPRLAIGAAVIAVALVVPTISIERTAGEALFAAWVASVATLNVVIAVRAIPDTVLDRVRGWLAARITLEPDGTEPARWDRRLPWLVALWVAGCCALLSWFVFDGVPHIDDSVAYYFQAKILALGRLQVAAPPDADSFGVTHLIVRGANWYGKFFPGWPALLALGVMANVPWLVNPLLGAAAVLLAHALVVRLHDRGTANATVLVLAASPWLLATSSEMMSHAATLVWALLALLAIDCQRGRRAGAWSLVAGAALGALYLTRPLDAALLGTAAALWGWGVGGRRLSLGSLVVIALVALGVASLMFPYNLVLTGHARVPPFRQWSDALFGPGVDVLGFGPHVGIPLWRNVDPLPGHGLADVVLNINKNLYLMSFELFGWATGSLLLAVLACLLGPWRRGDAIMLGVPLVVIAGYSLYWFPGGPDLGARYWYMIIVPLAVLTVRGAQMLATRLAGSGMRGAGIRVGAAMLLASVSAFACVMPWRSLTKYHRYRDISGDVRGLAAQHDWSHALIFVRSRYRADYQSAFNFNAPALGADGAVYASDAGPEHRAAVVRRFPDRPIWILGRPGDGRPRLVVTAGPLPAGVTPPGEPTAGDHPLQAVLP